MAELTDPVRGRSWVDGTDAGETPAMLPVSAAISRNACARLDPVESLRDSVS
jgi:hypothetical protein